ncbi:xanthine and CO dehydrogenases maturation factor XdhC/CoxF family [Clostridium aceticum]|uniref:Xanthine and CO dehydrogenases maturation factor XdhC/CoxF family n=1 Tax=Clostridium aceticum TaxID=84022 RepID=A0A0D8IGA0_9CLOT|nr:XdhC/CoxI family protein [Clostridium aceticum]AKL94568.1 xanthine and CO dehydrogenases maturation factor XdhC/CoxF family [Clostridium aceticum]KJF28231.1 xanthine dehydrogenase [Clostridium aceticum]
MKNLYKALLSKINEGSQCIMLTYLNVHNTRKGSIEKKIFLTNHEIEKKSFPFCDDVYEKMCLSLETGKLQMVSVEENKTVLIEPFLPKPRLVIFGGGHIAKPLSEFASRVGFATTIVDDRPSFANTQRFPEAEKVICENFQKSFDLIQLTKSDYVVIVTRGHRHDGIVLREVLNYDLSYIGMIGSRRKVNAMMKELLSEGFSQDKLDLVNSPIGLDIAAITPDEIAISIVSQLISFKNKVVLSKFGKNFILPEFDRSVMEEISTESAIPKAVITILSSKGSVPRKAGAKMVAYFDGRTIGSIGGGCSEAAVLSKIRENMTEKFFCIEHVDMTGDVAESEGMVCGGVMEVLVEIF